MVPTKGTFYFTSLIFGKDKINNFDVAIISGSFLCISRKVVAQIKLTEVKKGYFYFLAVMKLLCPCHINSNGPGVCTLGFYDTLTTFVHAMASGSPEPQ